MRAATSNPASDAREPLRRALALALAIGLGLGLAACGGDEPQTEPQEATPEVLTDPGAAATPEAQAPEGPDEGAAPALDADAEDALRQALQAMLYTEGASPESTTPGIVLLLETAGGRFEEAAGVTSLGEDGRPVALEDSFEIGSSTKPMTAVLILQLMEEGQLTLDDTLDRHLPEIAARLPNGDAITLRQLLNHTAGVWDYADPLIQAAIDAMPEDASLLEAAYTPEELVDYAIAEGAPFFAPGEEGQWMYSSTGYLLLGLVAEALTGQSVDALYRERIFEPLGMDSAVLIPGVPTGEELSTSGYYATSSDATTPDALTDTTRWNASQAWAAGGAAMSAADLAAFARAVGEGALFQDPATTEAMMEVVPFPDDPMGLLPFDGYGLGLQRFGEGFYGHNGQSAGFQSIWGVEPDTGLVLVGLVNNASYPAYDLLSARELLGGGVMDPAAGGMDGTDGAEDLQSIAMACQGELAFPLAEPDYAGKRPLDMAPFAAALKGWEEGRGAEVAALLEGAEIPDMQAAMEAGELSAVELLTHYLARIQRYDLDALNSVMELDPEALALAAALDEERAAGAARGPLHGIPVLVKDNVQVGERMHTSAGAHALKDWIAPEDAFLVARLRASGALVFGKANLSEWANYLDPCMPSGFSALGGQVRHPYGPFDPLGSSTGSAVAAAADLAAATVGTETQGSIIRPAATSMVVGLKTSRGLVSRGGVIPLVAWMDAPGPIGRSVTDVAIMLGGMAGADPADPESGPAADLDGTAYEEALGSVEGLRVGLPRYTEESARSGAEQLAATIAEQTGQAVPEEQLAVMAEQLLAAEPDPGIQAAADALEAAGATIVLVSPSDMPNASFLEVGQVLEYAFQASFDAYAAALGEAAPVGSLAEVAALNDEDPAMRIPYDQRYLRASVETEIDEAGGAALKASYVDETGEAMAAFFQDAGIDVFLPGSLYQSYAPAGHPALTVPSGFDEAGEPQGVLLVGDFLGEEALLAAGYAVEQALQARQPPDLEAVLATFPE